MKRFTALNTMIIGTLLSMHVSASEFFSHTIINLPNDYWTSKPWSKVINNQEELKTFYKALTHPFDICVTTDQNGNTFYEENPNLPIGVPCDDGSPDIDDELLPSIDFEQYTMVVGGLGFSSPCYLSFHISQVSYSDNHAYIKAQKMTEEGSYSCSAVVVTPTIGLLIRKTETENVHVSLSQYSSTLY